MGKTKILILALIVVTVGGLYFFFVNKKAPLTSPVNPLKITKEAAPSETLTDYSDPSGFTFSYPDNLSLTNKEIADQNTYSDLQLSSKDVSGSVSLKITDSKLSTIDEWVKSVTKSSDIKEVKLGNLAAKQIKLDDRLITASLDQGILFTVEMPLVEEKFWSKAYEKVLANFSFIAPESASGGNSASSDDISFEGEEIVE